MDSLILVDQPPTQGPKSTASEEAEPFVVEDDEASPTYEPAQGESTAAAAALESVRSDDFLLQPDPSLVDMANQRVDVVRKALADVEQQLATARRKADDLRDEHSRLLQAARRGFEEEVKQLRTEHNVEMQSLRQRTSSAQETLQKQVAALEKSHGLDMERSRLQYQAELAAAHQQHDSGLDALRQTHTAEVKAKELDFEKGDTWHLRPKPSRYTEFGTDERVQAAGLEVEARGRAYETSRPLWPSS